MDESIAMEDAAPKSGIEREKPQVDAARKAAVSLWLDKIVKAKEFHKQAFSRMREDMKFVSGAQWNGVVDENRYTANITQRHVQQKVAVLYARNPRAICRRRKRINNTVWDGTVTGFQSAIQNALIDPVAAAVVQDYQRVDAFKKMLDRLSETVEILYEHQLDQSDPSFKEQMKQCVRRTVVTGVAFMKIGIERLYERRPEDQQKVRDATERMATLERLLADVTDEKLPDDKAEYDQLRALLNDISSKPPDLVREGLVFDAPASHSVIVDPRCRNLKGFIGAEWVAQEFVITNDEVKEIYKKDLHTGDYTPYRDYGIPITDQDSEDGKPPLEGKVCVFEIYNRKDRLKYVVADGYGDYLVEPASPQPKLERFWPFFVLMFNAVENDGCIYPQSDVRLIRPMQLEFNRCRDGLREHRFANRPKTFVAKGRLDEQDRDKLQSHPANAVIEVNALNQGEKINDVLQPYVGPPIDDALYSVDPIYQDVLLTLGNSESSTGTPSQEVTATGESIAASARAASISSNVDDLDEFLSEMARAAGQVMLVEFGEPTVKAIVGDGAVWPQYSAQDVADEILLEIEAGSTGRPNRAAEIANFERMAPWFMQMQGLNPEWFVRRALMILDDRIDLSDAIIPGMPSAVMMNGQKQVGTGNPGSDPNAQGDKGGNKTPLGQSATPPQQMAYGQPEMQAM